MGREKADYYTRKAHEQGYPARSVFKLEEIQKKHHILARGANVLDLGAAPGSWSRYAAQFIGSNGSVVSVDLNKLNLPRPVENVTEIQGDMYDAAIVDQVRRLGPYDVLLSDAAPSTTGNRTVDTARSVALVEHAIELARTTLKPHGNVVVKLFQGGDEKRLTEVLRTLFGSAKVLKPKASRKESFETFLIGLDRIPPGESVAHDHTP